MEDQCRGITKSGNRCKIRTGLQNGYCRLHTDQQKEEPSVKTSKKSKHDTGVNSEPSFTEEVSAETRGSHALTIVLVVLVFAVGVVILKKLFQK